MRERLLTRVGGVKLLQRMLLSSTLLLFAACNKPVGPATETPANPTTPVVSEFIIDAPSTLVKGLRAPLAAHLRAEPNVALNDVVWSIAPTADATVATLNFDTGAALVASALGTTTVIAEVDIGGRTLHAEHTVTVTAPASYSVLVMIMNNENHYAGKTVQLTAQLLLGDGGAYTGAVNWAWTLNDPGSPVSKLKNQDNAAELYLGHAGSVAVSATANFDDPAQTLAGPPFTIESIGMPKIERISIEGFAHTVAAFGEKFTLYIKALMTDGSTQSPSATWAVNGGAPSTGTGATLEVTAQPTGGATEFSVTAVAPGGVNGDVGVTNKIPVDVPQALSASNNTLVLQKVQALDGSQTWYQGSFKWPVDAGAAGGYTIVAQGFDLRGDATISLARAGDYYATTECRNAASHVTQVGCGILVAGQDIYGTVFTRYSPNAAQTVNVSVDALAYYYLSEGTRAAPKTVRFDNSAEYQGMVMANAQKSTASVSYYAVSVPVTAANFGGTLSLVSYDGEAFLDVNSSVDGTTSICVGGILFAKIVSSLTGVSGKICKPDVAPPTGTTAPVIYVKVLGLPRVGNGGAAQFGGSRFCMRWDNPPLTDASKVSCSSSMAIPQH